ncbi:hypothetical protein [Streptomyces sp. NPDC051286]
MTTAPCKGVEETGVAMVLSVPYGDGGASAGAGAYSCSVKA